MDKVKCYYFWNKHFIPFKTLFEFTMRYFTKNIELVPIELYSNVETSDFRSLDFKKTITEKSIKAKDIIKEGIKNEEKILISDIDIVVHENFEHLLNLDKNDILFQKESSRQDNKKVNNTGFMFLKCSEKTFNLWATTLNIIQNSNQNIFINEQSIINKLLLSPNQSEKQKVIHEQFDDSIWAWSNKKIPNNILLHHANGTIPKNNKSSYELKIDQIKQVVDTYNHKLKKEILQII